MAVCAQDAEVEQIDQQSAHSQNEHVCRAPLHGPQQRRLVLSTSTAHCVRYLSKAKATATILTYQVAIVTQMMCGGGKGEMGLFGCPPGSVHHLTQHKECPPFFSQDATTLDITCLSHPQEADINALHTQYSAYSIF